MPTAAGASASAEAVLGQGGGGAYAKGLGKDLGWRWRAHRGIVTSLSLKRMVSHNQNIYIVSLLK
jgi:hypothetical protein